MKVFVEAFMPTILIAIPYSSHSHIHKIIIPTFKNEVRKFCRKRLAVKQCFALAQSNEKHTAGLP